MGLRMLIIVDVSKNHPVLVLHNLETSRLSRFPSRQNVVLFHITQTSYISKKK